MCNVSVLCYRYRDFGARYFLQEMNLNSSRIQLVQVSRMRELFVNGFAISFFPGISK